MTDDEFSAFITALEADRAAQIYLLGGLEDEILALKARLAACESLSVPPLPPDPPSQDGNVSLSVPPLLLNNASSGSDRGLGTEELTVTVGGPALAAGRVIRRDYGLVEPGTQNFRHEPMGRARKYSVTIDVPRDFKPVDMVNLFQFHTSTRRLPPYLSFFLWTSTSRWRHIRPDGNSSDHNKQPLNIGVASTYKLQVLARWSHGKDGHIQVYEGGLPVYEYNGPTVRRDEALGPYLLFGEYYPSVSASFQNSVTFSDLFVGDA